MTRNSMFLKSLLISFLLPLSSNEDPELNSVFECHGSSIDTKISSFSSPAFRDSSPPNGKDPLLPPPFAHAPRNPFAGLDLLRFPFFQCPIADCPPSFLQACRRHFFLEFTANDLGRSRLVQIDGPFFVPPSEKEKTPQENSSPLLTLWDGSPLVLS